jgi:hypothetical protein
MGREVLALFVAGLTLCLPATARAQPILGVRPPAGDAWSETASQQPVPIVMSASGGVSMGAYQAGGMWALVRFLRALNGLPADSQAARALPRYGLPVVTGASAGNINALFAAIEWCAAEPVTLEESLFWKSWVSVGWPQLFTRDITGAAPDAGVLGRQFFSDTLYPLIEKRLRAESHSGCEPITLGITLTRIEPRPFRLSENIAPRTQRFATVLVVQPERPLGALTFHQPPQRLRSRSLGAIVAPAVEPDARISVRRVFDLLEAASAFPVAFGPRVIGYYDARALQSDGRCPVAGGDGACDRADSASFVDGGVFDNNPLGLALELYRLTAPAETLVVNGSDRVDTVVVHAPFPTALYTAVNLHRGTLADRPPKRGERAQLGGLHAAVRLLAGAVPAAREYELQTVARTLAQGGDTLGQRIVAPTRAFPIMGEHLGGFAAFLGQPLREYDFLLGVYDGLHFAAASVLCHGVRRRFDQAECTSRELTGLLRGELFDLSPLTGHFLLELLWREYGGDVRIHSPELDEVERRRAVVLHALLDANQRHLHRASVPCSMPDWARRALCANGLDSLLRDIATPQVRETVGVWAQDSRSGSCESIGADGSALPPCRAEVTFEQLLANPSRAVRARAWQLAARLREVEEQIGRMRTGAPHYAFYVELAGFALHTLDSRARRGFYLNNTSIPPFDGSALRLMNLLPDHLAAGILRYFEYEIGWRPAYHMRESVGDRWALVVPVSLFWRPARGLPEGEGITYAAAGLGVVWKAGWLWLHELQASVRLNTSTSSVNGDLTPELAAYLLAGKVRLSLHSVPAKKNGVPAGTSPRLMIGIADLPGMLYWLSR